VQLERRPDGCDRRRRDDRGASEYEYTAAAGRPGNLVAELVFATQVPLPSDPDVTLELSGQSLVLKDPGTFAIHAPQGPLSRAAGPVTVTYDVVDQQIDTSVWLALTCPVTDSAPAAVGNVLTAASGALTVDLASEAAMTQQAVTDCTATITITQELPGATVSDDDGSEQLVGSAYAVASATLTSVP
jgi:hypothetical protein